MQGWWQCTSYVDEILFPKLSGMPARGLVAFGTLYAERLVSQNGLRRPWEKRPLSAIELGRSFSLGCDIPITQVKSLLGSSNRWCPHGTEPKGSWHVAVLGGVLLLDAMESIAEEGEMKEATEPISMIGDAACGVEREMRYQDSVISIIKSNQDSSKLGLPVDFSIFSEITD